MPRPLALVDLITPQYLAGIQLPEQVQKYLSILQVEEINVFYDTKYYVYSGVADFKMGEDNDAHYVRGDDHKIEHKKPNGASFNWDKKELHFRMRIPRKGAQFIDDIIQDPGDNENLKQIASLLNDFDVDDNNTDADLDDFPALAFQLELLVDVLNFTLGDDWKPGKLDADNRVVPDLDSPRQKVEIALPKVLLSYSQSNDAEDLNPQLEIKNWGTMGFDAPSDLAMGELVRMHPAIALHEQKNFAFSIDQVVIDCSAEATPSNVLKHFGVDEAWTGVYVGRALLYYSNDQGLGFNVRFKDVLISFDGEVSLEAALDVFMDETLSKLSVDPIFYDGGKKLEGLQWDRIPSPDNPHQGPQHGKITVPVGSVMQLDISGGMPPYIVEVSRNGIEVWGDANRTVHFGPEGLYSIKILVKDSSEGFSGPQKVVQNIDVTVKTPKKKDQEKDAPNNGTRADNPPSEEPLQPLENINYEGNDANHELKIEECEQGNKINIRVLRGPKPFTVFIKKDGAILKRKKNQHSIKWPVPNGTTLTVEVEFTPKPTPTDSHGRPDNFIYFKTAWPGSKQSTDKLKENGYTGKDPLNQDSETKDDPFNDSINKLSRELPDPSNLKKVKLEGWCSLKNPNYNDNDLACRRLVVVETILKKYWFKDLEVPPQFFQSIKQVHKDLPYQPKSNDKNQSVGITFFQKPNQGDKTLTATVERPEAPDTQGNPKPEPPQKTPTPKAPQLPNSIPPVLKQLGIHLKVEQNRLSLLELYGGIDFQTALDNKIKSEQERLSPNNPENSDGNSNVNNEPSVELKNPKDTNSENNGLVDFKITYQYDRATKATKYALSLGADEEDKDGLLQMENQGNSTFKNILGALLLFAPIISEEAGTVGDGTGDGTDKIMLGASLAVPIAIAGLDILRTRRVTLYGGEIYTRFVSHDNNSRTSKDFGITFDYEVEFDVVIESLGIGTNDEDPNPPMRARYKSIGANLNVSETDGKKGFGYTPIFDASKGYELDLSDPSLFEMDNALGDILNVVGARIARFNPVTLEVDFALKVNLGVVTVDKFKLKVPIDPVGPPMIIPSGVKVDIPGVLTGSGFVEIGDDSFAGGLDLTLVSLKIRIAGNLAVSKIEDDSEEDNKTEAVGVFVGLRVEFPTPIVLGATGLGIYGFLGVFAMHYKRLEEDRDPTSAVGPALQWLIKANGDPTKLQNNNGRLWGMALDHWSFGVGVILGTMEGGYLVNMQGMFVLELPGPRILIMVKAKMISKLPKNPADPATKLATGIIGIVDIDFERDQLTLGVMINFNIKQVLAVKLPIELYFKWDNPSNWHLWLGTIAQPASAEILGIAKGYAYLMIQGNELVYKDYGNRVPVSFQDKTLSGIALAMGMEAALLLGSESSGVYLKISARADLGVSFNPYLILGNMNFEGKLNLVVVSIGAHGNFYAQVSQKQNSDLKVYLDGEVCGSVDLFFFEIKACIGLTIGDEDFDVDPPELVRGVYLQSFSPVLTSGQGSTRPIDASLGNAREAGSANDAELITVPIDTIPVIQLHAAPKLATGFADQSFITSPGTANGTDGVIQLSDQVKVTYTLNSITLEEKQGNSYEKVDLTKVPSVWRIDRPRNGSPTDTSIDLATFSRTPTTAPHALERSKELTENTRSRWKNVCKKVAPPAPVLFTFCGQEIGCSISGWLLTGTPKPDPEGSIRRRPVNDTMRIYEEDAKTRFKASEILKRNLGYGSAGPAKIIGLENVNFQQPKKEGKPEKKTRKDDKEGAKQKRKEKRGGNDRHKENKNIKEHLKTLDPLLKQQVKSTIERMPQRQWIVKDISKKVKQKKKPRILKKPLKGVGPLIHKINLEHVPIRPKTRTDAPQPKTNPFMALLMEESEGFELADNYDCLRLLQLPYRKSHSPQLLKKLSGSKEFENREALQKYLDSFFEECSINFQTGGCESVVFLGGLLDLKPDKNSDHQGNFALSDPFLPEFNISSRLNRTYTASRQVDSFDVNDLLAAIEVEEVDADKNSLKKYKLSDLILSETETVEVLKKWLETEDSWKTGLTSALLYLLMQGKNYRPIMFKLQPKNENTVSVRIRSGIRGIEYPSMLIAAIETLPTAEKEHYANLNDLLKSEKETLKNYLEGDSDTPLLKPDGEYRISVEYTAKVETKTKEDETFTVKKEQDESQEFSFKTDKKPPDALAPYVLGTTPKMEENFHFYEDPLQVVFNDDAFLKMFKAYGKKLKAVIRGADGKNVGPKNENEPVENNTIGIDALDKFDAQVVSPYRETLESLVEHEKPCVGAISSEKHARFDAPFDLKPGMPYTFDIEIHPANPNNDTQANGEEKYTKPFFRTAFKTSRFANLEAFAKNCRANGLSHRAMRAEFEHLPSASHNSGKTQVHSLTDIAFENLLKSGGIDLGSNTGQTTISLLWLNASGNFRPFAVLIDTSEPLWRTRKEPGKQAVKNAQMEVDDPSFKIYQEKEVESMAVQAAGNKNRVKQFIKTTSGQKTLAVFSDDNIPVEGEECTLSLVQKESKLFDLPEKTAEIITFKLLPDAPWED